MSWSSPSAVRGYGANKIPMRDWIMGLEEVIVDCLYQRSPDWVSLGESWRVRGSASDDRLFSFLNFHGTNVRRVVICALVRASVARRSVNRWIYLQLDVHARRSGLRTH